MVNPSVRTLKEAIRTVPDFPKKGILFRDITTLLKDPNAFAEALQIFHDRYRNAGVRKVAGIESRGFIFGAALAHRLGVGFVPLRKRGKLPSATVREEYQLEYGTDSLEIHVDSIANGEPVLIHDDLLATGGTAAAACRLVEKLGGRVVGLAFLVELSFLKGREKLKNREVFSVIQYASEE